MASVTLSPGFLDLGYMRSMRLQGVDSMLDSVHVNSVSLVLNDNTLLRARRGIDTRGSN